MRILAFDTATEATAVALWDPEAGVSAEARDDPPPGERPRHQPKLLRLIADLLDQAPGGWATVDRIAVGVGPGGFTGLRIGVATARALGQARGIPLVAVSTLESLALNAGTASDASGTVIAVLDARRGEVFAAAWRTSGGHERILDPIALAPDALAERIPPLARGPLAIGTGAIEFRGPLEAAGASVPSDGSMLHRITAINHCRLASGLRAVGPAEIHPEYLRLPDAELTLSRRKSNPTTTR